MLGGTLVLSLNSGAKTLPLIATSGQNTTYRLRETLKSYEVNIRHSKVNRADGVYDRHNVEALITTFATATVPQYTQKAYFVMEHKPAYADKDPMLALTIFGSVGGAAATNLVALNNGEG